jgi:type II secretory pathway predicted ATPase ExeA
MSYKTFFELNDKPFQLSPDPEYFFPSAVHKEVMRHLLYSISTEEGFVEITGEPGMGKTITMRSLLMQIGEDVQVAMIVDPKISPQELVDTVVRDFGLQVQKQANEMTLRLLQKHLIPLYEKGVVSVIIIDEAQNLSDETLEQLCLISNIETEKQKLIKVILVGQLELSKNLRRPELLKIYQRITIRYRLRPLSLDDTIAYIQHRIRVAGGSGSTQPWFSEKIFRRIFLYSNGLPRLINIICDRSLMVAYSEQSRVIKHSHIKKALKSFMDEAAVTRYYKKARLIRNSILLGLILILCLLLLVMVF